MLRLTYRLLESPLEFTFTISRSSKQVARTVLVELQDDAHGLVGLGEAVPTAFYGETAESVMAFYNQVQASRLFETVDPLNVQDFETKLAAFEGHWAAKAALDMAVHDLRGKRLGAPLYRLWGLDAARAPKTSYTIGIDSLERVRHKTQTALQRGYDVLKVKLGGPQDWQSLALIRELAPAATLRVDANAAWTLAEAMAMLPRLAELGVEFVEEPLHLDCAPDDYARLKAESPLPLMADESCHRLADIARCALYFHSVNLKLTKTGGLSEAYRMLAAARAHGLKVMLGCFAETSVSITGFAQLSPLADYADLDGALLLAADPYDGVGFEGSQIILPDRPGIGVVARR